MNDVALRVDEQQAVLEAVKRIGESRGFSCLQSDNPADQSCAAQVWGEKTHAPAHIVVDRAVALVPEHTEHRGACGSLVERDVQNVDEALRPAPFAIGARFKKFVIGKNIADRDRFFHLRKIMADRERIELYVFLKIEMFEAVFDARVISNVAGLAGGILGKQRGGGTANELRASRQNA